MATIPHIPARHISPGSNRPVTRIVVHCTVSPCVEGGARNIARYFQSENAGGSAHYVVDPGEVIRCAFDSQIAWHAPPNRGSIGVELCDPMKGDGDRWDDTEHRAMLSRAARLVARLCVLHDVPVVRLTVADLNDGEWGICGHVDVSGAFGQSSHWDPGPAFPWRRFLREVAEAHERLTPKPPPPVHVAPPVTPRRAGPADPDPRRVWTFVMRRGQTLDHIAARTGVQVGRLHWLNPHIKNPNNLRFLQRVRVR